MFTSIHQVKWFLHIMLEDVMNSKKKLKYSDEVLWIYKNIGNQKVKLVAKHATICGGNLKWEYLLICMLICDWTSCTQAYSTTKDIDTNASPKTLYIATYDDLETFHESRKNEFNSYAPPTILFLCKNRNSLKK